MDYFDRLDSKYSLFYRLGAQSSFPQFKTHIFKQLIDQNKAPIHCLKKYVINQLT